MSRSYEKETDRFQARADTGEVFKIVQYTTITVDRSLEGPPEEREGRKRLCTAEGESVNYRGPDQYELVQTRQRLRRI